MNWGRGDDRPDFDPPDSPLSGLAAAIAVVLALAFLAGLLGWASGMWP